MSCLSSSALRGPLKAFRKLVLCVISLACCPSCVLLLICSVLLPFSSALPVSFRGYHWLWPRFGYGLVDVGRGAKNYFLAVQWGFPTKPQ